MICNWSIHYEPRTVLFDDFVGEEPGARFHLTSDWDDDFIVDCRIPQDIPISTWARALDAGVIPEYLRDTLPNLVSSIVMEHIDTGTAPFEVDLAERQGNQTARDLWLIENPPSV